MYCSHGIYTCLCNTFYVSTGSSQIMSPSNPCWHAILSLWDFIYSGFCLMNSVFSHFSFYKATCLQSSPLNPQGQCSLSILLYLFIFIQHGAVRAILPVENKWTILKNWFGLFKEFNPPSQHKYAPVTILHNQTPERQERNQSSVRNL